jgi:hypothetical protein
VNWIDPIVQEVREAREELARQANYDLHTFFQNLRKDEKKRKTEAVTKDSTEDRQAEIPQP